MVSVSGALRTVKRQLNQMVRPWLIQRLCRQCQHVWRKRELSPSLSIHLLLLQLLANVSLAGLRRVAKVAVSAQAIAQARQRLPLSVLLGLVEAVAAKLPPASKAEPRWKGHRVVLVDGVCVSAADTPAVADRHGRRRNQKGVSHGYPQPKLLAVLDWASGMICKLILLPKARGELAVLYSLLKCLRVGDLLLGDRGLVSYAHLALIHLGGLAGCFRLSRALVAGHRRRSHGRRVRRLGKQDWLVAWQADRKPRWLKPTLWAKLPRELLVRQIAFRLCRPGFRPTWAWLITTLTDPKRYPAEALVELYQRRWQVEVYFRDLKRTLGMRRLRAKTPMGIRKELAAWVLLYNLVRQVMAEAAERQEVEADRISFADALHWLLWSEPGEDLPVLVVNPRRRRRTEPRVLKGGRQKYARLARPRSQMQRPPYQAKL